MLPLNDSISVSINALVATTRVTVGQTVTENTVTVNGRLLASPEECERFQRVVDEFRKIVGGGGAAASSNEKAPTIAEGLRRSRRKRSRSIRKEEEIHVPVPVQQQQPKDWHIKVTQFFVI
jgi:hypothetical protein